MQIVSMTKLVIGIVFLVIAAGLFFARAEKGFGQTRQAAALSLVVAGIFIAIGLGFLEF